MTPASRAPPPASDAVAPAWHALALDGVAARLDTDPAAGLSTAEAARRRAAHGDNSLRAKPPEAWWWKFLR